MAYASWSVIAGEQPTAAKWNILGTNDSSFNDGTGIASGAITATKIGTDSSFAWTSWTPTFTNMVVTSSTVTAKFTQLGKIVSYRLAVVLGGTDKPSGAVSFTLPITSISYAGTNTLPIIGTCQFLIVNAYGGNTVWNTTTTANFTVFNAASTYIQAANISATVPNTFAAGSELHAEGFYEAA